MIFLFNAGSPRDGFVFSAISRVKIGRAIKAIDQKKKKKSPPPDRLEANLLKVAVDYFSEPIAHILFIFSQIYFPKEICLLLKIGPSTAHNHHFISTLPILDRILKYKINS